MKHKQVVNVYIFYKIQLWSYIQSADFTLGYSLYGAVKLTKNADFSKYSYYGYGIGFDSYERFCYLI